MLGVYNYTVIMTYAATLVSFWGMIYAIEGNYKAALFCLMISGVLDMFDGTVASSKKDRTDFQKKFGIQIDSMCDLICYGVLPALIVYRIGGHKHVVNGVAGLYLLAALIRLAYFNVEEEERQNMTDECRTSYLGMPVTMISLIFPAVYVICGLLGFPIERNPWVCVGVLAVCGTAFITPFKCIKPKLAVKVVLILAGAAVITGFVFL